MPETNVGMAVEAEPSCQYPVTFSCHMIHGSRRADKMASEVEVWMEQRCATELLHEEKNCTHQQIQQEFLNVCGDQPVDASTVRWSVCISVVATVMWKASHVPDSHEDSMWMACRLLSIAGENALANYGDYIEKWCSVAENLLYQTVLLCSLHLLYFPRK